MPLSRCNNIILRNIQLDCSKQKIDVKTSDKYELLDFTMDGELMTFE